MSKEPARPGGKILIEALIALGADTAFCVPGESYLATLDAVSGAGPRFRLVTCRQEGGAANMADAYAKLTGKPGLCFVTRGPGAANAAVGVHTAQQDATPMIVFVGQVPRRFAGRGGFQEVDIPAMFAPLAKWTATINAAARIPEMIARAWQVAMSGRPGPVVLALPEDVQTETAGVTDPAPWRALEIGPDPAAMTSLAERVKASARPVALVGGSGWTARAVADFQAFAEAFALPVIAAFRRQDLFDNTHPCYAGVVGLGTDPGVIARLRGSDLVLAAGAELGEVVCQGYTLFEPGTVDHLIQVAADPAALAAVYRPGLAIAATPAGFAAAARQLTPPNRAPWHDDTVAAHEGFLRFSSPNPPTDAVDLGRIITDLCAALPDDAIVASGAGNYTQWVHRFWRHRRFGTQLAPISGAMGYGVPAAIAAKLVYPQREVVSIAGDGCFLMCGQELATAARYGLGVVFIIANNASFGTIRMHQERHYPGRVVGTDLTNPDFALYARAFGGWGEVVTRTEDFAAALAAARDAARTGPALIELRTDLEAITPAVRLSQLAAR